MLIGKWKMREMQKSDEKIANSQVMGSMGSSRQKALLKTTNSKKKEHVAAPEVNSQEV